MNKQNIIACLLALVFQLVSAQDIGLHGTVKDVASQPVVGALIGLKQSGALALTDSAGVFTFSTINAIHDNAIYQKKINLLQIRQNKVVFQVMETQAMVTLDFYTLSGRKVANLVHGRFRQGAHTIVLNKENIAAKQMYLLRCSINNSVYCARYMPGIGGASVGTSTTPDKSIIARAPKEAYQQDTLVSAKFGFLSDTRIVTDLNGVVDIVLQTNTSDTIIPSSMKLLLPDTFIRGDNDGDSKEKPAHFVGLTRFMAIDSIEITQAFYKTILNVEPWLGFDTNNIDHGGIGNRLPVWYCDWYDAIVFCNARSKSEELDTVYEYDTLFGVAGNICSLSVVTLNRDANGYRLPTEAEWEYACRAGTATKYYWGDDTDPNVYNKYAWTLMNSNFTTHPGAQLLPNNFGLYDMLGSVWEWCFDYWNRDYYRDSLMFINPVITKSDEQKDHIRTHRGGYWNTRLYSCAGRHPGIYQEPQPNGFRCAMTIKFAIKERDIH